MSRLNRRSAGDHSELASALDTLTRDGAAPATVEPLSDLSLSASRFFRSRWGDWPIELRLSVVAQMATLADEDLRLNFERALLVALEDDDPEVRLAATNALWEAESSTLLGELLRRARQEPNTRVRQSLAVALGRFASLGSEGQLTADQHRDTEQALVDLAINDPEESVRLEAMAAAAYLRPTAVEAQIQYAFDEGHDEARELALRAMGRFGGRQWASRVIDSLRAGESDQRIEAARAAPYVEERRVVPYLYEAAEDDETPELQIAAIGALGEIGGREVRSFLEEVRDSTAGEISQAAEDALANARLLEGVASELN